MEIKQIHFNLTDMRIHQVSWTTTGTTVYTPGKVCHKLNRMYVQYAAFHRLHSSN